MVEKIKETIKIAKQKQKELKDKKTEKKLDNIFNNEKILNKVVEAGIEQQRAMMK